MSQLSSSEINIALLSLGGLVLGLGLLSGFLKKRLFLSDPIVALVLGVLLGPSVLKLMDLAHWGKLETILEQGARLAIAIQLMGVVLQLPKAYPLKQWRSLAVLLGLLSVAALFYAFLSLRKTGLESAWVAGNLIICASIIVHGLTAIPFAQLYSKYSSRSGVNL